MINYHYELNIDHTPVYDKETFVISIESFSFVFTDEFKNILIDLLFFEVSQNFILYKQ